MAAILRGRVNGDRASASGARHKRTALDQLGNSVDVGHFIDATLGLDLGEGNNMRQFAVYGLIVLGLATSACTDSKRASMNSKFTDQAADITCWSFGTEIFSGRSTGRVSRSEGAITFVDAANGRLTSIQGDCRMVYLPASK